MNMNSSFGNLRPPPLPLHRSKDIGDVRERLEELNKRYQDTFEVHKKINRLMRDKFAERLYDMIDNQRDREMLLKGFLLEYVAKEEVKD